MLSDLRQVRLDFTLSERFSPFGLRPDRTGLLAAAALRDLPLFPHTKWEGRRLMTFPNVSALRTSRSLLGRRAQRTARGGAPLRPGGGPKWRRGRAKMAAGARYFCTAGRGLEPFLAREVRARLGATEVRAAPRAALSAAALLSPPLPPPRGGKILNADRKCVSACLLVSLRWTMS